MQRTHGCNEHAEKCAMRNNFFRFFFQSHFKTTFFFFIFNLFSQFMSLTTHPLPPKKVLLKRALIKFSDICKFAICGIYIHKYLSMS